MRIIAIVSIVLFFADVVCCFPQGSTDNARDSLTLSGQLSLWGNYNNDLDIHLLTGGRYIPAINYGVRLSDHNLIDIEASANIFGNLAFNPFDTVTADGKFKPYRFWLRYSTRHLELRLGLQKINFGSATMLRPLMWFDQMDPRDPLNLTDGVWGLLGRYYFLNNTNVWLWFLYGNNNQRGFEIVPVNKRYPEYGGRIQIPLPRGEGAISYHHRTADNRGMIIFDNYYEKIPEDRFGFDAKWDLITGFWVEGSWTRKREDLGLMTNQEIMNLGIDYTFGIGNGLYMAYEHFLFSWDEKPFAFSGRTSFSLLSANYPIGLFDKISAIIYYNWTNKSIYNFVSWQRQFDRVMVYIMGYWNPVMYELPAQRGSANYYAGKGIQMMFVFNH